ncbi:uncharacterized protein LOC110447598 [Mizuhopecten yessoensis]|uniref:uncharacterized protein LOC110447598 n=1 Tax=Mizuhopecten yessoensis TaxID=6573 RepID=UPI000B45C06F|nr:uncharacterized protein LOC110447598 [Mizuhopecten yessoensis]XP_021349065.1 uncharacterized protein LOC110447598 [Mizuhopecten yessoensis]XP_021349066.1 uncharacterized protein LOC110447598 [Mizuhopecten yessoensis]XP_021349067.1 uncharacterized protein LOC110447598 [Mizuhopecten yessoensis]XP_021349068.1 uncharacterized protein LOC110447598 [Mizuhopecten yessoensis]
MAVASDTALDEQLTRNKSVTEPWITSPRNDDIKKGNSNDIKDDTTNGKTIANETTEKTEPSNSVSSKTDNTAEPLNENVNNESSETEDNKSNTKQSSLVVEKPEPEPEPEPESQSKENHNDKDGTNSQGNSEEVKPTLVGNVQKIEKMSISAKSNDIADLKPITDDDLGMYDPELFITDEERKAFEYMIERRRGEIENDKVKFEKWVDSLTRRRMFALSRLRKLKKGHGERVKLYGKVQDYVKEVESVLSSVSSSAKTVRSGNKRATVQSSKPHSATFSASKQTRRQVPETKDLQREITGFVNAPGSDKESGSTSTDSTSNHRNGFAKDESPKIVPVQS